MAKTNDEVIEILKVVVEKPESERRTYIESLGLTTEDQATLMAALLSCIFMGMKPEDLKTLE